MANEAETSLAGFVEAFGIVAGASLGVAALAVVIARALKLPLIPKWREPGAVWPGPVIIVLFLFYTVSLQTGIVLLDGAGVFKRLCGADFPPIAAPATSALGAAGGGLVEHVETTKRSAENQLRAMWTGFLVVPLMVALTLLARARVVESPATYRQFAEPLLGRVAFGVWTGLWLVPVSFGVNALTMWVTVQVENGFDRHPLSILRPEGDGYGGLVFALSVILVGPVVEELLFRGLVVNWAAGEWHRPWVVMVFAVAFTRTVAFVQRRTGMVVEYISVDEVAAG